MFGINGLRRQKTNNKLTNPPHHLVRVGDGQVGHGGAENVGLSGERRGKVGRLEVGGDGRRRPGGGGEAGGH